MAVEEVTVRRVTCDGCGKPIYIESGVAKRGPDPRGFSGTVNDEDEGTSYDWYACRDRCIRNAVVNVLG